MLFDRKDTSFQGRAEEKVYQKKYFEFPKKLQEKKSTS